MGRTAKRSSADTDSAHDLCLIVDTDLAKLDPCLKYGSQILLPTHGNRFFRRRKIKQHLIIIEGIPVSMSFHTEIVLLDLSQRIPLKAFFPSLVAALRLLVRRCRHADHWFQRLDHLLVIHLVGLQAPYPYSTPLAVLLTITWSPVLISFSPGLK